MCAYKHVHFIKTYDQVSRSYELVRARIYMSRDIYVDIIGLKFEKDLVGGCGEIDDLLGQHNYHLASSQSSFLSYA